VAEEKTEILIVTIGSESSHFACPLLADGFKLDSTKLHVTDCQFELFGLDVTVKKDID
jgi:hypothetical protein